MTSAVETKACARCGEAKPLEEFQRRASARNGRGSYCQPCARVMSREAHERRKADSVRMAARRAYEAEYRHRYDRERAYGISREDQDRMFAEQEGRCAVCRRTPEEVGGTTKAALSLQLDHNHATGKVRGFLCRHCNSALGLAGDDPERLIALASYLIERS